VPALSTWNEVHTADKKKKTETAEALTIYRDHNVAKDIRRVLIGEMDVTQGVLVVFECADTPMPCATSRGLDNRTWGTSRVPPTHTRRHAGFAELAVIHSAGKKTTAAPKYSVKDPWCHYPKCSWEVAQSFCRGNCAKFSAYFLMWIPPLSLGDGQLKLRTFTQKIPWLRMP